MAILHLQLEIDSDVSPELHAVLSAIGLSLPRAERLRQLASAGLIWEHLRLQALARTPNLPAVGLSELARVEALWGDSRPRPEPPAPPQPAPPAHESRRAATADDRAASQDSVFGEPEDAAAAVDLDALAGPALSAAGPPMIDIPVLEDVVEAADAALLQPVQLPPRSARGSTTRAAARADTARPLPARAVEAETSADPSADAASPPAPQKAPKAATRSRLARMQEKGLFKNG